MIIIMTCVETPTAHAAVQHRQAIKIPMLLCRTRLCNLAVYLELLVMLVSCLGLQTQSQKTPNLWTYKQQKKTPAFFTLTLVPCIQHRCWSISCFVVIVLDFFAAGDSSIDTSDSTADHSYTLLQQ